MNRSSGACQMRSCPNTGEPFVFTVRDGGFWSDDGGNALVFEVRPMKAFGFGKGDRFSQTRWRFPSA